MIGCKMIARFGIGAISLLASMCVYSGAAGTDKPMAIYQPPLAGVPFNRIVQQEAMPQLDYFFHKLSTEKENIVIDGISAMHSDDKFLPGKIAIAMSYIILNTPRDSPHFKQYLAQYRDIIDRTVRMDNTTLGCITQKKFSCLRTRALCRDKCIADRRWAPCSKAPCPELGSMVNACINLCGKC